MSDASPRPPRPRSYQDLEVWRDGVTLVREIHRLIRPRPSDERFGLTSQIRRAAVSFPSNVAEGWGRHKRGEFDQFLRYARGSSCEVDTQLVVAVEVGLSGAADVDALRQRVDVLSRRLLALRRS